jgi:hypothetical protein
LSRVSGGIEEGSTPCSLLSVCPQVHADLAVIDWIISREGFHAHLRALECAGLGKRLMFGSDQMFRPDAIGLAINGIESATFLMREQKRGHLLGNAGLPPKSWDRSARILAGEVFRGFLSSDHVEYVSPRLEGGA